MRKTLSLVSVLLLALGLVYCGGEGDGGESPTGPGENQEPSVSIDSPADGASVAEDAQVSLQGSASDPEDGSLTGDALTWRSDVDGQLGTGETVTVSGLSEGVHRITLEATDSEGATSSGTARLIVGSMATSGVVQVAIEDNAFVDPLGRRNTSASVVIDLGETVRWSYGSGSSVHTVTSGEGTGGTQGSGVPQGGTGIASGDLDSGDTFGFTPDAPGTWIYYCEVHPGTMYESRIIVRQSGTD